MAPGHGERIMAAMNAAIATNSMRHQGLSDRGQAFWEGNDMGDIHSGAILRAGPDRRRPGRAAR